MKEFKIDQFQAGQFYKLKTQSFIVLNKSNIEMAHTSVPPSRADFGPRKVCLIHLYFVTNRKKDMRHVRRTMTEASFLCYLNKLCPDDRRDLQKLS